MKTRILFAKTGRAKYLSHLDLMRTLERAFYRTGVKIRHTEGFNPHAYLSIALPLSVGMESNCELLDFALVDPVALDTLPGLLNAQLPDGIRAVEAYVSDRKIKELTWLRLSGVLHYDDAADTTAIASDLGAFFAAESISVEKLTKKKERTTVDIAPMIREIAFFPEDRRVTLGAVVAAQNPALNPNLLIHALTQNSSLLAPDFSAFLREDVLDGTGKSFR